MSNGKDLDTKNTISEMSPESNLEKLNRELMEELDTLDEESNEQHSGSRKHRSGAKNGKKGKKNKKGKKKIRPFHVVVTLLCLLILLMVVAVATILIFRSQGEKQLKESVVEETVTVPESAQIEDGGKSVVYNGERYWYNENIISILCMGVDKTIQETGEDSIGTNGQADALFLATLDTETGEFNLINISRDSMVDVNRYNVEGKYLETEKMQLCLAYSYGDGKESSCLNTAQSVSRLMYGMPIHAWAAIDYSGISVLNDLVGGVTVEVLEDISSVDSQLAAGNQVTLNGQQAHTYVRYRNTDELDSNNQRMARQKQYLTAFLQTVLSRTREDITFPLSLYQNALEYMVTDIDSQEVVYLASLAVQQGFSEGNMYSVPGQVVKGEEYAEFIPDEEGLYELILSVFYNKENQQ